MPPCASIPSMKNLMISAILIAAMPSALAQTEPPPESLPTAEVIEARMPGVYSASVEIDSRLAEYPAILTALREDELGNMGEFAMMALEDHRSWTEDAPSWSWNPYFSDTGIAVTFAHPEVLSLNRNTSYYTGGAHPNQGSNPIVTRTDRLRPAGLADLLEDTVTDSAGLTALFYAVYRELMAMKRERLGADFNEAMERETWLAPLAAELSAFPGFTLIPNPSGDAAGGLMFHFDPYAVGSYAEGGYDVPVPLSVFEEYLADAWTDVFDGFPAHDVLSESGDAFEPILPAEAD